MDWCIVNNSGVIENIIIADESFAISIGAKPSYDDARIGELYDESKVVVESTIDERVDALEAENTLLKAQIQAQTESTDFLEDCIAEMATVVYA